MNILIPLGSSSKFFPETEFFYPKPLIEVHGVPMIQRVIENLSTIPGTNKYIFIVNESDVKKHHLDNVLHLLTNNQCTVISLGANTKGAACSCLLAIEHINNDEELIISNGDQIIDTNFKDVISHFHKNNADGGVITFESVHPKWSYVKLFESKVVETAEKRPISKHAIAGFYYFKKGIDFVQAAMSMIEKENTHEGLFYIAPVYNELILEGKNIFTFEINPKRYHNLYSPKMIEEYERILHEKTPN